MRVLVLTPYLYGTAAGPRASFELWEPVLRGAGIELEYLAFETPGLHRCIYQPGHTGRKGFEMIRSYAGLVRRVRDARAYDAVLVNREAALIGPPWVERWVAWCGIPLVYLLDDPMWIPYRSPANGWMSYLKCFSKVDRLCRIACTVIVNSSGNRRYASERNDNVWQIPTMVDGNRYAGFQPRIFGEERVGVGWIGSASTTSNLRLIDRPLRALSERPDVSLSLIGADNLSQLGIAAPLTRWSAATEVAELRRLEIGLLPVAHSPWAPNKFFLKLVQYMALGIVPVATPAGDNPRMIEHGRTGFLVESEWDWTRTLDRLIADPGLRERVGRAAAAVAAEGYTLQANQERIVAAFRSALSQQAGVAASAAAPPPAAGRRSAPAPTSAAPRTVGPRPGRSR